MNPRNVEALERLVNEWENLDFKTHGDAPPLPEWLASRGVLVPSALTQADMEEASGFLWGDESRMEATEVAEQLEKIAKGESLDALDV